MRGAGAAKEAAAAVGYFSAQVTITLDRAQSPVAVALAWSPAMTRWRAFASRSMAAAGTLLGAPRIASVKAGGRCARVRSSRRRRGRPRNSARRRCWRQSYAAARLVSSEARRPARRADLQIAIDSGPPFCVGDIDIRACRGIRPSSCATSARSNGARTPTPSTISYAACLPRIFRQRAGQPRHRAGTQTTRSSRCLRRRSQRLEFGLGFHRTQFAPAPLQRRRHRRQGRSSTPTRGWKRKCRHRPATGAPARHARLARLVFRRPRGHRHRGLVTSTASVSFAGGMTSATRRV